MRRLAHVGLGHVEAVDGEIVEFAFADMAEIVVRPDRDIELLFPVRIHVAEKQRVTALFLIGPPAFVRGRDNLAALDHEALLGEPRLRDGKRQ